MTHPAKGSSDTRTSRLRFLLPVAALPAEGTDPAGILRKLQEAELFLQIRDMVIKPVLEFAFGAEQPAVKLLHARNEEMLEEVALCRGNGQAGFSIESSERFFLWNGAGIEQDLSKLEGPLHGGKKINKIPSSRGCH
jgi:hypothetical protein